MAEVASTTKHPEEIFPLIVWELIFDKLESPSDVATCFRTCRRELLESKRTHFLMPEMLPILCQYFNPESKEKRDEESNCNDGEPAVFQSMLLKMRLMCKSWKIGIDKYLGNPDYFHSSDSSCSADRDSFASLFKQIIMKARLHNNIRFFYYRIHKH